MGQVAIKIINIENLSSLLSRDKWVRLDMMMINSRSEQLQTTTVNKCLEVKQLLLTSEVNILESEAVEEEKVVMVDL
jgi:hypothetical protein